MQKTILVTGATDGIGFETAKMLVSLCHTVLLHGRNVEKLQNLEKELSALSEAGRIETYVAGSDLRIGVEILVRACFYDEFADASGKCFNNDIGQLEVV